MLCDSYDDKTHRALIQTTVVEKPTFPLRSTMSTHVTRVMLPLRSSNGDIYVEGLSFDMANQLLKR